MALLGLVKNELQWVVVPGLAIVIGLFFHTALLADGSITQVSGGSTIAIATASTSATSVWLAIQWIPITITIILPFFVVVYRVGMALK